MKNIIGIVGNGVVGAATGGLYIRLPNTYEVRFYDKEQRRCSHNLDSVMGASVVFVCLPTPLYSDPTQGLDLSALDDFFGRVRGSSTQIVLRSTVPIGATSKLARCYGLTNPPLLHYPEFLTERNADADAAHPGRIVVGGPYLANWQVLQHIMAPFKHQPITPILCSRQESEAIKLFSNAYLATKVSLSNELRQLAAICGLDWERVREGVTKDPRIGHSHTQVPGPDGVYGFGGSCLPKDLACLITEFEKRAAVQPDILLAVSSRNHRDRRSCAGPTQPIQRSET